MKAHLKMGNDEMRCEGKDCDEFISQFKKIVTRQREHRALSRAIEYLNTSQCILQGNSNYIAYRELINEIEDKLLEEIEVLKEAKNEMR